MAVTDNKEKLIKLLAVTGRVHDEIITHMTDKIGMECIADFASFFSKDDYEAGVHAKIVAHTSLKDSDMAVARLRSAWKLAVAEFDKATTAIVKGNVELNDWDVALSDEQEAVRKTEFETAYPGLEFDSESTPAVQLVGRVSREFKDAKRQISILALAKMRSVSDYMNLPANVKKQLAEGVEVTLTDQPRLPDITFRTVLQLMHSMKLLCNLWIWTGAEKVDSKERPGEKVHMIHQTQAMSYGDFFMRKAMEHPGPARLTLRWLLQRDRQTRGKARQLYAAGYPFGEALLRARDFDCQVLWTCGATGIAEAQIAVVPGADDDDVDMLEDREPPLPGRRKKRPSRAARQRKKAQQQTQTQQPGQQQGGQRNGDQWRKRPWQASGSGGKGGAGGKGGR